MSEPLPPVARGIRAAVVSVLAAGFLLLALFDPARGAPFPKLECPFHAATGLPCLFCGATRACHAALNGDFHRAAGLNLLAFPVLAVGLVGGAILLAEAVAGRPLLPWPRVLAFLKRAAPVLGILAALWWAPHVLLALRSGNPDLVDPQKPPAALLKSWLGGSPAATQ